MSEQPTAVRGIIIGHGDLAVGLIDATRSITGIAPDALQGISNTGKAPDALVRDLAALLDGGPTVIFTDLQAGSCAFCARRLCREHGGTALITGVNLPMLVDFAMNRTLPLDELLARLVDRGRSGITMADVGVRGNADRPPPDR
jgi:mannose/fructose-specific phosphotransferase system component IIA